MFLFKYSAFNDANFFDLTSSYFSFIEDNFDDLEENVENKLTEDLDD